MANQKGDTVSKGHYFNVCTDETNKTFETRYFHTDGEDVEFNDGDDAETKVGAIKGITSDLNTTTEGYAADMTTVAKINSSLIYWIENGYLPDPNNPIPILTLYDNGTIGSVTLQKTSNAKITYDADCIKIASAVNTKINAIYFSVDFTNYRTLYIKAVGYSNSAQWSCGYSQSVPDENITSSIYRTNINANSGDIAIDISALKGIYYPFITGYKNQSGVEQPSCLYKMYLEP